MLLLAAVPVSADRDFSTLEERMTGQEYRDTGLHKLSPEELAALNAWIRRHVPLSAEPLRAPEADQPATASTTEDTRGLRQRPEQADGPIVSRVVGPFTGWDGNTVFELENGMVWRQNESGTFYIPETHSAEVEISESLLGGWRLRVKGYNRRVSVERVR